MGKGGQTSSVSLTGVLSVQKRCRSRRSGDANMTDRHLRHTCTSLFHPRPRNSQRSIFARQKSKISRRTSSERAPIVTRGEICPTTYNTISHRHRGQQLSAAHSTYPVLEPPLIPFDNIARAFPSSCEFQKTHLFGLEKHQRVSDGRHQCHWTGSLSLMVQR